MAEPAVATSSNRLESLDVFRGLTIALMVLVNNPGSWSHIYAPFAHAPWDGWTPTDFVFPFFLFIVGVAMTFSFDKRLARGDSRLRLFEQVIRRTIILFLLGLILTGFPNLRLIGPYILVIASLAFIYADEPVLGFGTNSKQKRDKLIGWGLFIAGVVWFFVDFQHFQGRTRPAELNQIWPLTNDLGTNSLRIPGVLQRIAICYFFASIIIMKTGVRGRIAWTLVLINAYWLIMRYLQPPAGFTLAGVEGTVRDATAGAPYPGALNDFIDQVYLNTHLYKFRPDPEGILSTIPAIATVLCGVLTGNWLHTKETKENKALGMFIAGNILIIAGAAMDYYFPINKKIWTSSYVIFMAGWALVILAACFWANDIKGWRRWSWPFMVVGTNAILVFFGSGLLARLMGMIKWETGPDTTITLKNFIYQNLFTDHIETLKTASLCFAIFYVVVWVFLTYPLYRGKIFLKI